MEFVGGSGNTQAGGLSPGLTSASFSTVRSPYHDNGLRCRHCVFVVFLGPRSVACGNPKCCYGQAGWDTKCSAFVREIGADDDLPPIR